MRSEAQAYRTENGYQRAYLTSKNEHQEHDSDDDEEVQQKTATSDNRKSIKVKQKYWSADSWRQTNWKVWLKVKQHVKNSTNTHTHAHTAIDRTIDWIGQYASNNKQNQAKKLWQKNRLCEAQPIQNKQQEEQTHSRTHNKERQS